MTLRLKCIRCGDWDEMEPDEVYGWGLCGVCWGAHPDLYPDSRAFHRWTDRWQRDCERHPTYKALIAALDAMEATPHGAFDSGSISIGGPEAEDDVLCFVSSPVLQPSDF